MANKIVDSIGNRIRKGLEARDMRAVDLSRRTGISKGSLSQYMSNTYEPRQDNIYLMASALNVDPAWLLGYDVPMSKEDAYSDKNAELLARILTNEHIVDAVQKISKLSDADLYTISKIADALIALREKNSNN